MSQSLRSIFANGLRDNNVIFVQALALCPTMAVTGTATNGLGMGLATTVVLVISNVAISLLRNAISEAVRIPVFIIIIASLVTLVDMALNAWLHELYKVLGLFIALIVVKAAGGGAGGVRPGRAAGSSPGGDGALPERLRGEPPGGDQGPGGEKKSLRADLHESTRTNEREILELYKRALARCAAAGILRPFHLTTAALGILGQINWLYHWYRPEGPLTVRELADQVVTFLLRGLLSDGRPPEASA